ncbi:MAG: hypothetical protein ACR2OC_08410 [Solirubrobacterales bacterium]
MSSGIGSCADSTHMDKLFMSLPGPSRTIVVEPIEQPKPAEEPVPERDPVPAEEPAPEKAPLEPAKT